MDKESTKSGFFKVQRFSSRLVIRVFIASSVCLIIPLILYSLIAIQTDYNNTKKSIYQAQLDLTGEKIDFLEEIIDVEFAALSAINHLIQEPGALPDEISQVLRGFAGGAFVSATYYIDANGKVIASSLDEIESLDFSVFVGHHALENKHEKLFVATDPQGNRGIFLSQIVYSKSDNSIKGYLLFDLRSEWLLSTIFLLKEGHKAQILLIDDNNIIIAASRKEWIGKQVPIGPLKEVYSLEYQGTKYLAVAEPIDDSTLRLVNIVDKKALFTSVQELAVQFVVLLLVIIAIGMGLVLFLLTRLSQPIRSIQEAMERVCSGDLSFKYKPLKLGFEINAIGEMFNETVDELVKVMDEAKVAKVNEEVYHKELSLGQEVQHSLLPVLPSHLEEIQVAGKFVSAKQVGGDCYDFIPSKNERDLFFIADTAGKGIMACLFALNLRGLLRAFCQSGKSASEIVKDANAMFLHDTKDSGVFVTAWVGLYHRHTRQIEYINMGHLPALLKRANGEIETLTTDGIAFGVMPLDEVEVKTVFVNPGDILYLYTDGITEAMNQAGEFYGFERFIALIRGIQLEDVDEITERIYENVRDFGRGVEQFDDLTLMVTRYT